jgi:hypothetical protein
MVKSTQEVKNNFIYAQSRYHGKFRPEYLAFNANLQEFANKVGYISALETAGKLSPEEAYKQIHALWKQLKHSKKQLGIGNQGKF